MVQQPEQPTSPLDTSFDAWSRAAAAVVARSRRIEPADLDDTPESLLSTITRDGVTIRPLYTRKDERAEPAMPGSFPFVRGADPTRDPLAGWRVTQRFGDIGQTPAAINTAILDSMLAGTSGLWLRVGESLGVADIAQALAGVYLDLVPVTLDAGPLGIEAARALLAAKSATAGEGAAPTAATTLSLGLSPLTTAYSGRATVSESAATTLAVEISGSPGVRTLRVDGTDFATAGADNSLELALITAAAVTHLRDLTAAGLTPAAALRQITFAVSVADDQFAAIAKLRALRQIWARVAEVVGAASAGAAIIHAVTDLSMYSQRDPWVNMLRSTIATFGAGAGGADQVTVLGFDAALPAHLRTSSPTFSDRIARNTQLLLLEESNIGRVLDPAGGSWFVESLTADLAAKAWAIFTDIERQGGYRASLASGWIDQRVAASLHLREVAVAHRREPVTGVSEFPNPADPPLPEAPADTTDLVGATPRLARVGRAFERLRDRSDIQLSRTGSRPTVLLVPLGSAAEHTARTTFTRNLLAAGGITAITPARLDGSGLDDTNLTASDLAAAATDARTSVAVLCGSSSRYRHDGPAALAAIRAAGLTHVLLAGPHHDWPATQSAHDSDAPDGFLGAGIDAITALTELSERLAPTVSTGVTS